MAVTLGGYTSLGERLGQFLNVSCNFMRHGYLVLPKQGGLCVYPQSKDGSQKERGTDFGIGSLVIWLVPQNIAM